MKNPYLNKITFSVIEFDEYGNPTNLIKILDENKSQWAHASGRSYVRTTRAWLNKQHAINRVEGGRTEILIFGEVEIIQYDDGDSGEAHYRKCDKSFVEIFVSPITFKEWVGVPSDESLKKQRIEEGREKSRGCTIS